MKKKVSQFILIIFNFKQQQQLLQKKITKPSIDSEIASQLEVNLIHSVQNYLTLFLLSIIFLNHEKS